MLQTMCCLFQVAQTRHIPTSEIYVGVPHVGTKSMTEVRKDVKNFKTGVHM